MCYPVHFLIPANGSVNDLQSASQQIPNGTGGWEDVAVKYYRHYLPTDSGGFTHGLKMRFGPEAYRLMVNAGIDVDTAADSVVKPYADNYFEYDGSQRVTLETSAVCESCPGGGSTSDSFSYSTGPGGGYADWAMKTVQTLPDGSQIVVYTNYVGLPILYVAIDSTGENMWGTFYRYNDNGQVIWQAMPSALALPSDLSTLEAYSDLLNYNTTTLRYEYVNNDTGLIEVTDYFGPTETPAGYVKDLQVQQGQSGTPVMTRSFTYASQTDSGGNTVRPVASVTDYVGGTTSVTTSFSYIWESGTGQPLQVTTTLPAVSSGQNGDGVSPTTVEVYDLYGNMTQFTDERGIVNKYTFAGLLGLMTEQVLNYQSGVTQPGVNVTNDFTYDIQGRLIQTLGPSHTVVLSGTATTVRPATWYVYVQSIQPVSGTWDVDQTWIGRGYATGSGPSYTYTLIDPVMVNNTDKDGRITDVITSRRTTGSGALLPTDTFAQTDWQSWSSAQYDDQHRTISQRVYFLIPSSGTGTEGTNYGETDLGYDALERLNRVQAPGGTITRTVWTAPQRLASVWVGTDDTGATDSNPAGSGSPNNMVMVSQNQYDGGSAGGDGNLTQLTEYASSTDTRVTSFGFDWRNRHTSATDALGGYVVYTYDNLDRVTQTQQYASVGGNLIAQNAVNYDARGRVYQQLIYAVDPTTGIVGNSLVGNSWYDYSGNLLQNIGPGDGQVFTKSTYNGVNWVTATYTGYNPSGTSYSQAGTVTSDIILEQALNTFDEVGNIVSTSSFQRLNDAPSSGTGSTGALSYGTQPQARVSYMANWFDGINRRIASADYGAIASFTRPDAPPSSSSTVLVTSTSYNEAGQPSQTIDSMGCITQTAYDNAFRITQIVEDYGSGMLNRTTNWTYTLDNLVASLTAVNSTTGNQTTTWTYGTTLTTSGAARNDLLASVAYPDSVSGSDVVSYTYNTLGQQVTVTDQRGTVRTFYYDKLARQTDDCVSTVGSSTDDAVLRISTTYEVRGMPATITSYDNAAPGSGTALNQCALTYNSFGQLTKEQQDHSGAVSGSSPSVQYAYDSGASSSNEIRLNGLTYPNGRVITYSFGTSGGMNDQLNRIDAIQDTTSGTTGLASYTYLGLGTVVRIEYPEPSVWLDLWGGTSGTFAGLDLFNRIIDQRWQNNITGAPTDVDRYQYGYDRDSNRLYKANVVGTPVVTGGLDEYYDYDHLNRLVEMQRGTLNSTKTGITGTPVREMDWTLDSTGNWPTYLTKTSGTTDLNQTRTSNKVNEITAVSESTGPTSITPAYDAAGNTTTMPQVTDPTQSFTAVYDGWNRTVKVSASGTTVAQYEYDGQNRRAVKLIYSGGTLSETRHFYFTNQWQDVEERVGTSTSMDKQYVWGTRYIDELVCRDDVTPERLYACQDANFNLTSITNTSGDIQERYLFDPYGDRAILGTSWSVIGSSSFAWIVGRQGLLHDQGSGLIGNRLRVLHAMLAVFLSRDTTVQPRGEGLYSYLGSSPTGRIDPFGDRWISPDSRRGGTGPAKKPPTGCRVRTHCFIPLPHCGVDVDQNGNVRQIDGSGPGQPYSKVISDIITNGPGFSMAGHAWIRDQPYPKETANSPVHFGPWSDLPSSACDCLLSGTRQGSFNQALNASGTQYHPTTTNSGWALKCFLGSCGVQISWSLLPPPGYADPTPCPCTR